MSALSARRPHWERPSARQIGLGLAGLLLSMAVGAVAGRLSISHYGKTLLEIVGVCAVAVAAMAAVSRKPDLAVGSILAALAVVPIYDAPVKQHLILHPALILCVLVALGLARVTFVHWRPRVSVADVCVGLIALGLLLDTLFGPRTWKEASNQLWLWLPAYFAGRAIASRRPLSRAFAAGTVVGAVALSPFAIIEALGLGSPFFSATSGSVLTSSTWDQPHLRVGESFRVQTSWGHPIAYSMFVAVAIVFAVVLYGASTGRQRRLLLLALPLLVVSEALSLSRTGIVVIAVTLVIIAAGRARNRASQTARRAVTFGAVGLVVVALLVPSIAAVPLSIVGLQSDSGTSQTNTQLQNSASYRTGLYTLALNNHVASWFGNKTSKFAHLVETHSTSVDSAYLNVLDTYGIATTLPLVALVLVLVVSSLVDGEHDDEWSRTFRATAVGMAVAVASVAFITQQEYFVWLIFGLAGVPRSAAPLLGTPGEDGRWFFRQAAVAPRAADRPLGLVLAAKLRRLWWIPLLGALISAGVTVGAAKAKGQQYAATASILFGTPHYDQLLFGPIAATRAHPTRAADTRLDLLGLSVLSARTAAAIGGGLTAEQVTSELAVAETGLGDVYTITATDGSPSRAARIANTYAQQYQALATAQQRANGAPGLAVLAHRVATMTPAERSTPAGQNVVSNLIGLRLVAALESGDMERLGVAHASPAAPFKKKNAIYGALPGLLLGLIFICYVARRDRRLIDGLALEQGFDTRLLASVRLPRGGYAQVPDRGEGVDSMDMLRANLRHLGVERELSSLLITSPESGDGKTALALELAYAEAAAGTGRVLIVEADLRRPALAERLDLTAGPGLAELLSSHIPLSDVVRTVPVPAHHDGATGRTVDVLPVTSTPPNPAGLVESHAMAELLAIAADEYDLVIVDTPSLGALPDALTLAGLTAGVVVVTRPGAVKEHQARVLRDRLDAVRAPVLGVVANLGPESRHRRRRPNLIARWGS